jgi:hypothetical protein
MTRHNVLPTQECTLLIVSAQLSVLQVNTIGNVRCYPPSVLGINQQRPCASIDGRLVLRPPAAAGPIVAGKCFQQQQVHMQWSQ